MTRILAALDNSLAASPALALARALAPLLGSEVDAIHVVDDGEDTARQAAQAAGLPLHTVRGPPVKALVHAGMDSDVVAMVIGARATAAGPRPLGSTALAVATSLPKPVVVVPPDASVTGGIRRVLVPIEGERSASLIPRTIIELAESAELDVIALYVLEAGSLPAFTDQPQHERQAWTEEFVRRYCRWRTGSLRLETRVGPPEDLVPMVAEQVDADLIALGWAQELGPGRAPIVRAVLERGHRPVLLVPVTLPVGAHHG